MSGKEINIINNDENVELNQAKKLTLKDFPPKLRLVASAMLAAEDKITISDAARSVNLNEKSILQMIHQQKQKGKDFYVLINTVTYDMLKNNTYNVDKKTLQEGLNGTHKDRELFYKRTGILKNEAHITHDHLVTVSLPQPRNDTRTGTREVESVTVELLDSSQESED